jgi:hypothetical protein
MYSSQTRPEAPGQIGHIWPEITGFTYCLLFSLPVARACYCYCSPDDHILSGGCMVHKSSWIFQIDYPELEVTDDQYG